MVNIPVKFKRVAAAFDEVARVTSCESSGSEHTADLSDLVNSFFEREIREQRGGDQETDDWSEINDDSESNTQDFEFEYKEPLKKLFDRGNEAVERSIKAEVETALAEVAGGENSSPDFKRRVMTQLRSRGFDAGLCKSKWEKTNLNPSGNYEYIDVNAGGSRYIVEVFLAGKFTIARPADCYASLLDVFPAIFVGKPDELKQVVKLMCRAIRKSMKLAELKVPPWRRLSYMQAKWFGSHKRTTNEIPLRKASENAWYMGGNRSVGFVPVPMGVSSNCRGDFAAKSGGRIGNLTAALNQKEMLL
ncbi:hypothetical protein CDL12_05975 [Handroanthus impetiginosus]|uniref:DUF506 family protein n=1 Tax=Handroanthus impetiginosus TaxID=429701 RepID=A0A2G9HUZ2_9LAMI|nr:hypothetical protein CDL12_05975 [Handroanthus impetiginosus]